MNVFGVIFTLSFNLFFSTSTFPSSFKFARITPILKKPGLLLDDPACYRPISNQMTLSKVLERLCLVRIFPHITNSPNFNPHQSAYLPGQGTETALIKISDELYQIIDKGSSAVLVSLDVSTAFDTIIHDRLLHRLTTDFGLSGLALAKPLKPN